MGRKPQWLKGRLLNHIGSTPERGRRAALCRTIGFATVCVCAVVAASPSSYAYSVLSYEQLIDLSWKETIVPVLLSRLPALTTEQLRRAHAYSYGGCLIQDLGYYPFGNGFFSNLTHYVRSGDFTQSPFHNAHTPDELAFAIGALSHYIGDTIGNSQATSPAVADEFPKLRAKFGWFVNYAQAKNPHVQVEFAFDIKETSKKRLPPAAYFRHIGLLVPGHQLASAFYDTYGLAIGEVVELYPPAVRTYRFGVRTFIPAFAYAEALLHSGGFPPHSPSPELELYKQRLAEVHLEAEWGPFRKDPGIGTYLVAGLIVILPKIGPLAILSIRGPTVDTERRYLASMNLAAAALKRGARQLAISGAANPSRDALPNRDLDTGAAVVPGGYPLTDRTYADLLAAVTKHPERPLPPGLIQAIIAYYADPGAPIVTKRNRKASALLQRRLQLLRSIPAERNAGTNEVFS